MPTYHLLPVPEADDHAVADDGACRCAPEREGGSFVHKPLGAATGPWAIATQGESGKRLYVSGIRQPGLN